MSADEGACREYASSDQTGVSLCYVLDEGSRGCTGADTSSAALGSYEGVSAVGKMV